MTFNDLNKVNSKLVGIDVKGKSYIEVNQRVMAFRELYPEGTIKTELVSDNEGRCVFKAEIYDGERLLASGTAYEKESSSFINKTSYIENCETSAVGRALGFLGIGIERSIASAEEVLNAMENQKPKTITETMEKTILNELSRTGIGKAQLCKAYGVGALMELQAKDYADIMDKLKAKPDKEKNES